MATKLNKKASTPKTVQQVAKVHKLELGYSANGNLQFKKEPLQDLYELTVSTLFGKQKFYESSDQTVARVRARVRDVVNMGAYDFVANLAIHARKEMNIRTIPIVVVVEFAAALREQQESYPLMRQLVCDVIQRADQINDMYAYALDVFGSKNKIPLAIKRGVADAFNKFGEYHFAKWKGNGVVTFKDVLRIVHPKAKNVEQGDIFKKIMEENLSIPYTWETELSRNGQLDVRERKSQKDLWTELVKSGKVGYMALLRNLRNIAQADVDPSVVQTYVADVIADEGRVAASKQLTFDFVEAYNVISPINSKMATSVSKAIDASTKYLPKMGERVWIIIDFSGSMSGNAVSTATLLAAALIKANDTASNLSVTLFGSSAKTLKGVDTNNSVLAIQKMLLSERRGSIAGSTNFEAALDERKQLSFTPDTVIVFTDGEINRFPFQKMKNTGNSNVVKVVVNLDAAPTTPFINHEWFAMAGWSPAMFRWIPAMRNKETVVDRLSGAYTGLTKSKQEVDE